MPIGATALSIGIPALFNLGKSLFGAGQLANNRRPSRPQYEIPSAVRSYLTRRNVMANQDMPGRDLIEDRIGANVANTIGDVNRAASSSGAALGAITNVNQRAQEAISDLGIQSAQYRQQQMDKAAEAQRYMADYQEKEWEYNKNLPYQRAMNEYTQKKQAGNANLWGGLEGIGSSVLQGFGSMKRNEQIQSLIDAIKGGDMSAANAVAGTSVYDAIGSGNMGGMSAPSLSGFPSAVAWKMAQGLINR